MTPCQYEGRATSADQVCRGCRVFIHASELEMGRQESEQMESLRNQQSQQATRSPGRGRRR